MPESAARAVPFARQGLIEVDVLYTQLEAILNSQPRPIEQHDDKPHRARQLLEDPAHFVAAEHDGHADRLSGPWHGLDRAYFNPEDVPVEEQQRAECLILCRRTDTLLDGQPRQERRDLWRPHVRRVRLLMKDDVSTDPVRVSLLRPATVVPRTDRSAHSREEFWRSVHVEVSA